MNLIRKYLNKIRNIPKIKNHPLIHKVHSEHGISKKTILYVKEYGRHSNIPKTIIKESINILLFTSLISSLGGFALESIKGTIMSLIPLIILLPVLNNMVGSYGTIISSRLSTIMHKSGELKGEFKNKELTKLYLQIKIVSLLIVLLAVLAAMTISYFNNRFFNIFIIGKIFLIVLINVLIMINLLFFISVFFGMYFYRRGKDPDNLLIPITTSVADFGNMIILTLLVIIFF